MVMSGPTVGGMTVVGRAVVHVGVGFRASRAVVLVVCLIIGVTLLRRVLLPSRIV